MDTRARSVSDAVEPELALRDRPVIELAHKGFVAVTRTATIARAAEIMKKYGFRHLPVVDGSSFPVGMVSEYDLYDPPRLGGRSPLVSEVMKTPILTIEHTDSAEVGAQRMLREGIRALLVTAGSSAYGSLTTSDLLRFGAGLDDFWASVPVTRVLRAPVHLLGKNDSLAAGARMLAHCGVRHLVVVGQTGRPLGMLTEMDLRNLLWRQRSSSGIRISAPVRQAMSRPVWTIESSATAEDTAKRMLSKSVRALPVNRGGKMIGIVTETDLVRDLLARPIYQSRLEAA